MMNAEEYKGIKNTKEWTLKSDISPFFYQNGNKSALLTFWQVIGINKWNTKAFSKSIAESRSQNNRKINQIKRFSKWFKRKAITEQWGGKLNKKEPIGHE